VSYIGYNFRNIMHCMCSLGNICVHIYLYSYIGRDVDSYCSRKVVPHRMRVVL
jgi:hypothetical protein